MKAIVTAGCLAALLLAAAGDAIAKSNRWVHLGSRTVTDRVDHDVIVVKGKDRELRAVKLTVRKKAVEFRKVKIFFANGTTQELNIRRVVPAGGETRIIDLIGKQRIVTRVELTYDAQSLGGKAVVRLFGRR
jgi:hypothetical protein